jgi:hypothetical protein
MIVLRGYTCTIAYLAARVKTRQMAWAVGSLMMCWGIVELLWHFKTAGL